QHSFLNAAAKIAAPKLHKGIVTYTEGGNTAMMLSKMHPEVPIYALTPHAKTCQKMSLIRNVRAYISPAAESMDNLIAYGDQTLIKEKVFKKKDTVVITAGSKLSVGATNMMKIHNIGDFV
ncbi:MAG TPA: pyruvate kinase alpha/beta domain-containing protein, partial [Oligoflexia bacterium]|nr:pyruvate kinase alpha/beta domain-containing protein [Oligoflexia bacterium]